MTLSQAKAADSGAPGVTLTCAKAGTSGKTAPIVAIVGSRTGTAFAFL